MTTQLSFEELTETSISLEYGAFMRSTTPQERVEAITRYVLDCLWYDKPIGPDHLKAILNWMTEAAGPQGYEVVPLDWIRKLRQAKDAARSG